MTKTTAAELIREDADDEWVAHTSQWREEAVEVMKAQIARIAELEAKLDAVLAPKPAAYPEPVAHSSTPWYPDDSGEWVEVPEDLEAMPKELNPDQQIHVLLETERARNQNNVEDRYPSCAQMYAWDRSCGEAFRIVAYKVVTP